MASWRPLARRCWTRVRWLAVGVDTERSEFLLSLIALWSALALGLADTTRPSRSLAALSVRMPLDAWLVLALLMGLGLLLGVIMESNVARILALLLHVFFWTHLAHLLLFEVAPRSVSGFAFGILATEAAWAVWRLIWAHAAEWRVRWRRG